MKAKIRPMCMDEPCGVSIEGRVSSVDNDTGEIRVYAINEDEQTVLDLRMTKDESLRLAAHILAMAGRQW